MHFLFGTPSDQHMTRHEMESAPLVSSCHMSNLYERIFEILMHRSSLGRRSIKKSLTLSSNRAPAPFVISTFIKLSIVFVTMQQHIFSIMRTCEMAHGIPEWTRNERNRSGCVTHFDAFCTLIRLFPYDGSPNTTQPFDIDGADCVHSIFARVPGLFHSSAIVLCVIRRFSCVPWNVCRYSDPCHTALLFDLISVWLRRGNKCIRRNENVLKNSILHTFSR